MLICLKYWDYAMMPIPALRVSDAMTAQTDPAEPFHPQLVDFADRIRWVRVFEVRVSVKEMARRLDFPVATVASWEEGSLPRDKAQVALRYHDVAPHVDRDWLLFGGGSVVRVTCQLQILGILDDNSWSVAG